MTRRDLGFDGDDAKLTQALAQLSDAEWAQVKCNEDRRRAQQRTIRDLSRELRDRKIDPEPAR